MTTAITRIGNSHGIVLDAELMESAGLKPGDELSIEVQDGGRLTLTPIRPRPSRAEVSRVIQETMKDYAGTMQRLA